jgi:hypothetical protein
VPYPAPAGNVSPGPPGKDKTALFQKGVTTPDCHLGTCNPFNFTILDPEDPKWKNDQQTAIYIYE